MIQCGSRNNNVIFFKFAESSVQNPANLTMHSRPTHNPDNNDHTDTTSTTLSYSSTTSATNTTTQAPNPASGAPCSLAVSAATLAFALFLCFETGV